MRALPRLRAALGRTVALAVGDRQAERVVPPSGRTAWLSVLSAAAMAALAVFALALLLASGRLGAYWAEGLSRGLTVRVPTTSGALDAADQAAAVEAVTTILAQTPGAGAVRAVTTAEQAALLAPWLGPGLPVEALPLPGLVELVDTGDLDVAGLRLRLAAEVPGAVLDDHAHWRRPLVRAAARVRAVGWLALGIVAATTAAIVTLAAQASLSANAEVIRVLRQIGARDAYVTRAFTRRFTLRAFGGAVLGTAAGLLIARLLPGVPVAGATPGAGAFDGASWLWALTIPPFAGLVAFVATRRAALRALARFE